MPTEDKYVADSWRVFLLRLQGVRPLTSGFLIYEREQGGYTTSGMFVVVGRYGSILVDQNCAFDLRDPSYLLIFRAVGSQPRIVENKIQWTDILDVVCQA